LVKADKGNPLNMEQTLAIGKRKPFIGMRFPEKRKGRRALFQV